MNEQTKNPTSLGDAPIHHIIVLPSCVYSNHFLTKQCTVFV